MSQKNGLLLLIFILILSACSHQSTKVNPREYQIGAYLWQQHSGEYKALTYQAYNLAKEKMIKDLENKHNRKRAVIFDVDETVLDNSVGGAREIKTAIPWNEEQFASWVKLKQAVAIPAALEFIKFLDERQVEIFYVTNRKVDMLEDTFINLKNEGFPVKKAHLLMLDKEKSKEPRRLEVAKKYDIILYVGDNLTDFDKAFDVKDNADRSAAVVKNKDRFGDKYIILPNPQYGDWEKVLGFERSRIDLLKVEP